MYRESDWVVDTDVRLEMVEQTSESLSKWIKRSGNQNSDFLLPNHSDKSRHTSTRQHARIVKRWVKNIGLDDAADGTHSMRRTKPELIYKRTKNLRAVRLQPGHTKLESTVRYLGIDVDDALEMAEQTEV